MTQHLEMFPPKTPGEKISDLIVCLHCTIIVSKTSGAPYTTELHVLTQLAKASCGTLDHILGAIGLEPCLKMAPEERAMVLFLQI